MAVKEIKGRHGGEINDKQQLKREFTD